MHYPALLTLALSTLFGSSQAADFVVNVGQNGFIYTPDHVSAAVGDTVTFHFFPSSHSVTQGTFATPCTPLAGGFTSGFRSGSTSITTDNTFQITVNDTRPIWIHCEQVGHCPSGMVFAINAANDTQLAQYRQNAISPGSASTASGPASGTFSGVSAPTSSNVYGSPSGAALSAGNVATAVLFTILAASVGVLFM